MSQFDQRIAGKIEGDMITDFYDFDPVTDQFFFGAKLSDEFKIRFAIGRREKILPWWKYPDSNPGWTKRERRNFKKEWVALGFLLESIKEGMVAAR